MADASTAATAATAAAGGGSSWFSPQLVSSLVQLAPALFQMGAGRKQGKEAEKMQQALGPRVAYGIPDSAKRALGIAEDLARPREMAGQTYMQYMMDQENAKTLGRASRAATSSQDLLGVITQLGEAGQEGQLKLGTAAAEDYNKRQQTLQSALGTMATFQDKVTADRQLDWNQRAAAAAAMKGAAMKNRMGALQGFTQSAVEFLGSDAAKNLFSGGATDTPPSSYNFTPSSSLPTTVQTTGIFDNAPKSTTIAPQTNAFNFSSPSYNNYNSKLGLEGSYLYPDTPVQQQPGFYNGIDMNDWRTGFFNNIH